jgi:hypothetical protein
MPRTAQECRVQWAAAPHIDGAPVPWSPAEISQMQALLEGKDAEKGEVDWTDVAEKLGVRVVSPLN